MDDITVLADSPRNVSGTVRDRQAIVAADTLVELLGWELKPEGLCRDDVCVPVRDRSAIEVDDGVDLVKVAAALDRPTLLDPESNTVVVGAPAADRRAGLRDRQAPDFTLPDLDGVPQTLSGWTGKKRLLVAFASW